MLLAARNALRRGGLATGQQGMLHRMEECAAAAAGPLLPVWPGASANDGVRCSLPVPQPGSCGSRSLCITAEGGSRRASGAEASPHGHAAGAHAGHQAASSSSSGGSAGEASAAEEDEEADARASETRQRILEAALRHVVRTVCGFLCWQLSKKLAPGVGVQSYTHTPAPVHGRGKLARQRQHTSSGTRSESPVPHTCSSLACRASRGGRWRRYRPVPGSAACPRRRPPWWRTTRRAWCRCAGVGRTARAAFAAC